MLDLEARLSRREDALAQAAAGDFDVQLALDPDRDDALSAV